MTLMPTMALGHTEVIKRAVENSDGWAFVSRLAVANETRSGLLRIIEVEGWNVQRPLHRLKLQGKYEGRAVREFVRILREHCRTRA